MDCYKEEEEEEGWKSLLANGTLLRKMEVSEVLLYFKVVCIRLVGWLSEWMSNGHNNFII